MAGLALLGALLTAATVVVVVEVGSGLPPWNPVGEHPFGFGAGLGWVVLLPIVGLCAVRLGGALRTDSRSRHRLRVPAAAWPVLLLVGAVASLAWFATPNDVDAQTYHIPRAFHWLAQGSVAHYETDELRQLHLAPFTEYLYLLVLGAGGSISALPLLHAVGFALLGAAGHALGRELGYGRRGRWFAATAVLSIPMAALQGATAQNDLFASLWLLLTALGILRLQRDPRLVHVVWVAAAAGLGVLTKGTFYLFGGTLGVWFACVMVRRARVRTIVSHLAVGAVIFAALNVGHWARNLQTFGSPLGPAAETGGFAYLNADAGPKTWVSNAVRNAALHLATPSTAWNDTVVTAVHGGLGALAIDPNDPETTWLGTTFGLNPHPNDCAYAPAPLHVFGAIGLVLAVVVGRWWRGGRMGRRVAPIGIAVALGFAVFCGALRWQPWHARLHLPLISLAATLLWPALGTARRRWARWLVIAVLCMPAVAVIVGARRRPLLQDGLPGLQAIGGSVVDRSIGDQLHFGDRDAARAVERMFGDVRSGVPSLRVLGLVLPPNAFEARLWAEAWPSGIALQHVEDRPPGALANALLGSEGWIAAVDAAVADTWFAEAQRIGVPRSWFAGRYGGFELYLPPAVPRRTRRIVLDADAGPGWRLGDGWFGPEAWGCWTKERARLHFGAEGFVRGARLRVLGLVGGVTDGGQILRVLDGTDREIARARLTRRPTEVEFELPWGTDGAAVVFEVDLTAVSSAPGDARRLGVSIGELVVSVLAGEAGRPAGVPARPAVAPNSGSPELRPGR